MMTHLRDYSRGGKVSVLQEKYLSFHMHAMCPIEFFFWLQEFKFIFSLVPHYIFTEQELEETTGAVKLSKWKKKTCRAKNKSPFRIFLTLAGDHYLHINIQQKLYRW